MVDEAMKLLGYFPQSRATILSITPNLVQAYLAATADYYTWQLSERIYGVGSATAWATVSTLSIMSSLSLTPPSLS